MWLRLLLCSSLLLLVCMHPLQGHLRVNIPALALILLDHHVPCPLFVPGVRLHRAARVVEAQPHVPRCGGFKPRRIPLQDVQTNDPTVMFIYVGPR